MTPTLPPNKEKANHFSTNLAAPPSRYHIIIENKKLVNVPLWYSLHCKLQVHTGNQFCTIQNQSRALGSALVQYGITFCLLMKQNATIKRLLFD